jgi:rhamnosyltransferase
MVVIPLFGEIPRDLPVFLTSLDQAGLTPVIVDNRREEDPPAGLPQVSIACMLRNRNRGGIAGALNRGVTAAIARGAEWITILDQDSRVDPAGLRRLLEPLLPCPERRLVVGPTIWDTQRNRAHERPRRTEERLVPTRLLISSGTTFHASQWAGLGPFHEGLFIDYVDHFWSFRAQQRGYRLLRHNGVVLLQQFGHPHPNILCRWLGMQLYSPVRHFYSLRNLRWLIQQDCIPTDLKMKELLKMMVKPWCWLLFEPQRQENLRAIIRALTTGVPRES